jgi:hypothetical protein
VKYLVALKSAWRAIRTIKSAKNIITLKGLTPGKWAQIFLDSKSTGTKALEDQPSGYFKIKKKRL